MHVPVTQPSNVVRETSVESSVFSNTEGDHESPEDFGRVGDVDRSDWSSSRLAVARVIESRRFEVALGLVISFNIVTMVLEADANVDCNSTNCAGYFIRTSGYVVLAVYGFELGLRAFVKRRKLLFSGWDVLDMFIVILGVIDVLIQIIYVQNPLPATNSLRMFRLLRLLRASRLLEVFPPLRGMIRSFISAIMAMFWGSATILLLLLMFAIFAVEVVHPQNKNVTYDESSREWCMEAFSSVSTAILFLFQTSLIGDAWGDCVIPLVSTHWWLFIYFAAALFLIQLGLMNLILTAIVEEAQAAHERDVEARFRAEKAAEAKHVRKLGPMFRDIDTDGSGELSDKEVLAAYDRDPDLRRILTLLGIDRENLRELIHLMDSDGSGTVNQNEFVRAMHENHKPDIRTQVMAMKLQLSQVGRSLDKKVEKLVKNVNRMLGGQSQPKSSAAKVASDHQPGYGDAASSSTSDLLTHASATSIAVKRVLAALEAELDIFKSLRLQLAPQARATGELPEPCTKVSSSGCFRQGQAELGSHRAPPAGTTGGLCKSLTQGSRESSLDRVISTPLDYKPDGALVAKDAHWNATTASADGLGDSNESEAVPI